MKKLLCALIIGLLFSIMPVLAVEAHILKTDGTIGAVLHVSPEDDPIAGEESAFFFEFKDRENRFRPEDCDCVVTVIRRGEEIYSQDLFRNNPDPSLTNASFFYTFPQRSVYTVSVQGKPKDGVSFRPFTLTYDVRVERESDTGSEQSSSDPSAVYIVIGGVLLFFFAIYIMKKHRKGGETKK